MARKRSRASPLLLGDDLVEEILFRLPAKELPRFRRLSKRWRAVIEDPIFIEQHAARGTPRMLLVTSPWRIRGPGRGEFDPMVNHTHDDGFTLRTHIGDEAELIGSSNGVLCLYLRRKRSIMLMNPATLEGLTLPADPGGSTGFLLYGFGYNPRTKLYTVLCGKYRGIICYLYTVCRDSSWRTLEVTCPIDDDDDAIFHTPLTCVGGHMYWGLCDPFADELSERITVGFLDLETESFGFMTFAPPASSSLLLDHTKPSFYCMSELEGRPCLVLSWAGPAAVVQMWTLADGVPSATSEWSCRLTVDLSSLALKCSAMALSRVIIHDGRIWLNERRAVLCYNYHEITGGEGGEASVVVESWKPYSIEVDSYLDIEALVESWHVTAGSRRRK